MLLTFDSYSRQAGNLATLLEMPLSVIKRHKFPDGESKLTLPAELPERVIFCLSLDKPNDKLVELMLAADAARELGAKHLTLVAPYMCYMRQDIAFHPGEVVSQKIIGKLISRYFDDFISVDPHLHRITHLQQAFPVQHALALSATEAMTAFLSARLDSPYILGPDSESLQWVEEVAKPQKWDFAVCHKDRLGDREVKVSLPDINLKGRAVVIVDDMVSSGQTLIEASRLCFENEALSVDVLITHALFVQQAERNILNAGVGNIWSTDSVTHHTNVIPLDKLLHSAVLALRE